MTREEVLKLKPGHKITYDFSNFAPSPWRERLEQIQEENGGYFTFHSFNDRRVVVAKTKDGDYRYFGQIQNIKLYKISWSYKRDY
jgi:hypothetical protein